MADGGGRGAPGQAADLAATVAELRRLWGALAVCWHSGPLPWNQETAQAVVGITRHGPMLFDAIDALTAENARLRRRPDLLHGECRCDPPGSGGESCTGHCYILADLARERRRTAAIRAVLNAPMWEPDDETDETICRCEWCLAETATLASTYRCRECGYQGQPMAWGCLDPENVERMSRERGDRYDLGNVTCPVCGEGELEADPWRALRAIRQALAADAPGQAAGKGRGDELGVRAGSTILRRGDAQGGDVHR